MKQEFTKEDTLVVKGMAIFCLLFYHLFEHYERVTTMGVNYTPFTIETFLLLSGFGNICVAVFAFLSAYGITKGMMGRQQEGIREQYRHSCKRYLKLTANFLAMFLSVNLLWFNKFNYTRLYGGGIQGCLYAFLDAFGLSGLFKTPTINETWWYMELAILIIFFVPILYDVAKKMGTCSILIAILLPVAVELTFDVKRYYLVILLGVVAARQMWFEKLFCLQTAFWKQAVCGVVLLAVTVVIRQNYVIYHEFAYLMDAWAAFLFSWFGGRVLSAVPGIRQIFALFGRHSMNIYFVHTFFYMAIYQEFIYSFRYAGVIFAVLLAVSLVYSLILEGLKKLFGFEKGLRLIEKI